jgi:hypothetical protein
MAIAGDGGLRQPTLSALEQKAVWEGWLGAEIRAKYFGELCHRYQTAQQVATWLTLVASSGALATLLGEWVPPAGGWVRPLLAATATGLSLYSLVAQNQKKSGDCSDLHARWQTLSNDYEALWNDMYAPDARDRFTALRKREVEVGKSSTTFPNDAKRLERWQDHVHRHHAATAA